MNHDEQYMHRAIELALRGSGSVSPNPMVGAVLVHGGRIIGEGWHAHYGGVHAEVACLEQVAETDRKLIPESTMYVTLEPCAHQGRQPPCANRLVAEGIRKVVIAVEDPFPQVSGKGIAILRDAGIEVETGLCREEARWMCRRFLQAQEGGRPYIILKWAQSADGYVAPADGSRYQLSNHYSRTIVHKWRTEESAIMVGYNTALADNPQLTARAWNGPQPLRIALDRALRLPLSHYLLDDITPTWIVNELEERDGITRRVKLSFDDELIPALLQQLINAGKNSLFVEGGARLLHGFIETGLWDEVRVFETPALLGGGIPAPLPQKGTQVFSTTIGDDMLHVFQRADSRYTYIPGQIL